MKFPKLSGNTAEKNMQQAMSQYDGAKVNAFLAKQEIDLVAVENFYKHMDVNTAMLFYCDPKISKKIAGYKSADGHDLVTETKDHLVVWLADEQREKSLRKIFSTIDPETKTQYNALFDEETNELIIAHGGTDFTDLKDVKSATDALAGGSSLRAGMGAKLTEQALSNLYEIYPDLEPYQIKAFTVGHSNFEDASTKIALAHHGIVTHASAHIDSCGTHTMYKAIEEFTGVKEELLERNVKTFKGAKGPLDYFTKAMKTIGIVENAGAAGHKGVHYMDVFNKKHFTRL